MVGFHPMFFRRFSGYADPVFMNWTSTEHSKWAEQCRAFAIARKPFRLEHIFGKKEEAFCDDLCGEQNLRQEKHGAFVLFTPNVD